MRNFPEVLARYAATFPILFSVSDPKTPQQVLVTLLSDASINMGTSEYGQIHYPTNFADSLRQFMEHQVPMRGPGGSKHPASSKHPTFCSACLRRLTHRRWWVFSRGGSAPTARRSTAVESGRIAAAGSSTPSSQRRVMAYSCNPHG